MKEMWRAKIDFRALSAVVTGVLLILGMPADLGISGFAVPSQRPSGETPIGVHHAATRRTTSGSPGDAFDSAIPISELPFTFLGEPTAYTAEEDEPAACDDDFYDPSRTIWFRFRPSVDTGLEVKVQSENFELLQFWAGDSIESLSQLACSEFGASSDSNVRAGIRIRSGDTVHVQVDTQEGDNPFSIGMNEIPIPANDDFEGARHVELPLTVDATTHGASVQANEPDGCAAIGASLWFRANVTANEPYVVESRELTSEYPFYPLVAIYEGSALRELSLVACGHEAVMYMGAPGKTYYIQVAGRANEVGAVNVTAGRGGAVSYGALYARASEDGRVDAAANGVVASMFVSGDAHLDDDSSPELEACAHALAFAECQELG